MKKSCRQRWRVNLFCFLVSSPVYCHNMSGHLFSFWLWRWENLVVARQNCVLFSVFVSFTGICPNLIRNRDAVTLRSWQVTDDEFIIVNFSVKHPVQHLRNIETTDFFFKHEVPDIDRFVHWWCQWRCLEWGLCSRNMSFILLFLVWL